MYICSSSLVTRFVRFDGGDSLNESSEKGCSAKNWVTENSINISITLSEWTSELDIGCTHGHYVLFTEITKSHGVQFSVPRDHIFSWNKCQSIGLFKITRIMWKKSNFIFLYQDLSGSEYTCPRVNYSDIRVLLHAVELFEFPAFFAIMINLVHSQNHQLVN